jgi:hypothetical protein
MQIGRLVGVPERIQIARCPNVRHGSLSGRLRTEYDPDCSTCWAKALLAEHDHLHLGGARCKAVNVRCKCGAFHH